MLSQLRRLRRAAVIAVVVWPFFGLVDWFVVSFVTPGRLWFYLLLRGIGLLVLLVAVLQIFGTKRISGARMRGLDIFVTSSLTILITISCIEFGGIASPLAMGVVTVLLSRSVVVSDHWKRGILPIGLIVVSYPLTLLVMAGFSPTIAAQFSESRTLARFVVNLMFVGAAGVIVVAGGHMVWALKRQVYNSRTLGCYRLKKRVGAGGMGEVWLAHHNALRRDVAIKILKPEKGNDSKAIARFEREVHATSELSHPNTVRVYDYGITDDGLWYYAMELLDGCDLHEAVLRNGPMHPQRAAFLIAQAARALAEAHNHGIVHRDIKPENVFLTNINGEGDFVKVLDFGLAKLLVADEGSESLTQVGWAVGTPQWVSPEVVLGNEADERSDIYGLGAVLYFLLCGQSPFGQVEMRKILHAHMHTSPKTPSEHLGYALPYNIETLVMRCLAKNPDERFQSGAELSKALDECVYVQADSCDVTLDSTRRDIHSLPDTQESLEMIPTIEDHRKPQESVTKPLVRIAKLHNA